MPSVLLAYLPPAVVFAPEPLAEDRNALHPWRMAVDRFVKPSDDNDLWGGLVYGSPDSGEPITFPGGAEGLPIRELLENNREVLALLDEGIGLGSLQFPDLHAANDLRPDSEFASSLGEVARLPLIRAKVAVADGRLADAADDLIRTLRIGEMISNGQGQLLHYLVGLWIRSAAIRAIQRLGTNAETPRNVVERLLAAVEQSLRTPDGLANCLRADLCAISLPQLDRTPENLDLGRFVERLLEIHYTEHPLGDEEGDQPDVIPLERPLAWRRRQIMILLEGHPKPFDKLATARLMGRIVADAVTELDRLGVSQFLNLGGHFRRLRRRVGRWRLGRKAAVWPMQFTPAFPYVALMASDAKEAAVVGSESEDSQLVLNLPSEADLTAARTKLRRIANPVGLMLAEYLLPMDYGPFAFRHRAKLNDVQRHLATQLNPSK